MNIVKSWRESKGISQRELATRCGVSQPTVSDWEQGNKIPTGERLVTLAKAMGVRPSKILADYYDNRAA